MLRIDTPVNRPNTINQMRMKGVRAQYYLQQYRNATSK